MSDAPAQPTPTQATLSSPETPSDVNRRIGLTSAGMMTAHAATYLVRCAKVLIIAFFFGTGVQIETYQAAINLPTVIIGVLQGALVAAVVPILVDVRLRRGPMASAQLWTRFGLGALGALALLCLGLGLAANPIARAITDPARHDPALAAHLLRLLLGYITLFAVVQGTVLIFQSHHRFVLPVLLSLPNLLVNIVVIVAWFRFIRVDVEGLVWGLYIGALVQLGLMLLAGRRSRILHPAWGPAPEMGRATRNTGVLLLTGLLSPATLVTIDIIMAAPVERGIATLNYAYAIFMFPVTVGIMNLGYVLLPYLAGQVTAGDWAGLRRTISATTRLLLYVTVPVAAGLWLVSDDLIQAILERGEFTHDDTLRVGATLRAYTWGLLFAGLSVIVTKVFNAMQRVRALFVVSAVAFGAKIAANALLRGPLGAPGIAFATALFYALSFVLLAIWLWRTVPLRIEQATARTLVLTLVGGAVMIAAVLAARTALAGAGWPVTALLAVEICLGTAIWIVWSLITRLSEFGMIWRLLAQRAQCREPLADEAEGPSPV